jgi:hypothetical protein
MPELRWTLALVGALFVVVLAIWEFRRQRQAPRQPSDQGPQGSVDRGSAGIPEGGGVGIADTSRHYREPTITLPELHPDGRAEPRFSGRREIAGELPVVEVDDAAFARLDVQGATDALTSAGAGGSAHEIQVDDVLANDALADDTPDEPSRVASAMEAADSFSAGAGAEDVRFEASVREIKVGDPAGHLSDSAFGRGSRKSFSGIPEAASPASAETPDTGAPAAAWLGDAVSEANGSNGSSPDHQSVGFATDDDESPPARSATSQSPAPHPAGATADGGPVVEWPHEETRKIVALRLVSAPAARFPGRALRQALAAEGFVLGKFDIFHKPGPDDRAVLSAASLSKPGTFAMNTIDAQRFGGISLFAVLPGPLSAEETFDQLLSTARNLNDRLQGALQDERGEPLTPMRSASIRQSLCDGPSAMSSGTQSETRQ